MSRTKRRLSLAECRRLIPPGISIVDGELESLRDRLYVVAQLIRAAYTKQPAKLADAFDQVPQSDRAEVEERAAIAEFEGNLNREQSERLALADYMRSKSRH